MSENLPFIDRVLVEGSGTCPCCNRFMKVYRRKLNASMAATLCHLRRESGDGFPWLHRNDFMKVQCPEPGTSKLLYWRLVEELSVDAAKLGGGKTSGVYRITPLGRDFVDRKAVVFSHVVLLLGEVISLEGNEIVIDDALTERFDYDELMRETVTS